VREQVDLLNRFRGVMPEEELERRKQELFSILAPDQKEDEGRSEEDAVDADDEEVKEPPKKKAAK